MKDQKVYLQHMLDAIKDVESFTKEATREDFLNNKMMQNAVIRSLEVIGEAVKSLSPSIRRSNSQVPWKQIAGMRDILIHEYFGVDEEKVWNVIVYRLPVLKKELRKILKELK